MLPRLRASLVMLGLLTALTGVAYPLVVTGVAQAVFPAQANGSLIEASGKVRGSRLIGQPFEDARYFWGRLSATSSVPYNGDASGGSNLGPLNPVLLDNARARLRALREADPGAPASVPVDLVTASGSGLDPDISIAAAQYQVPRVARARGMSESEVRAIVAATAEPRQLGVLGEPVVNVLEANLALDGKR